MKKIFWLVKDGKRTGPHRPEELQDKIAAGEVQAGDLVFYPGSKGLERIGNLEDFDFGGSGGGNGKGQSGGGDRSGGAPAPSPKPSPRPSRQEAQPKPAQSPAPQSPKPAEPEDASGNRSVQKSPPPPKPRLPTPQPQQDAESAQQQRRPSTRILSRRELEKESSRLEAELQRVRDAQSPNHGQPGGDMRDTTPLVVDNPGSQRPAPFKKKPAPPTELSSHAKKDEPEIEIDYSFAEDAVRQEDEYQRQAEGSEPEESPSPSSSASPPAPPEQGDQKQSTEVKPRPGSQPGTSGDIYGMQTVVINAPGRKSRPRRNEPVERERSDKEADRQYPDVIKAALRSVEDQGEDAEIISPDRDSSDVLPEARQNQLRESVEERKPRHKIKPEFENSLGIGFVAVEGLPLGFGIWPVRVKDYRAFVTESGYDAGDKWRNPDFLQLGDNPVTYVSYDDACAFCLWLTEKERAEGWLDPRQVYRLPSDAEWSVAVGLREVGAKMPHQLNGKDTKNYPWGTEWPPPKGVGNYSDESADRKFGWGMIAKGYDDGYVYTSPVGAFPPNQNRLFDMGGNVWEWVQEWFDDSQTTRTLRGASWTTTQQEHCLSSAREADPPEARRGKNGFRIVLAAE